MSIPLINEVNKNDINTSIIAIKKNIERINTLLGLNNTEEIDTSIFATKEELEQAKTDLAPVDEVTLDNMQSVTSNAVAETVATINNSLRNKLTTKDIDTTNYNLINRVNEKILSLGALDSNKSGLSIDFDYNAGIIRLYHIVNGVTQGLKTIQ